MKRIVLYSTHSLFNEGIRNLLDDEPTFEVIGWESDPDAIIRCIQATRPDAVVVVNNGASDTPGTAGIRLLKAGQNLQIVELYLEDHSGYAYMGRWLTIQDASGLVKAVEALVGDTARRPF